MKIVVIVPSLNEEDSISAIAKIIDQGLSKYYPDSNSVILNVDSNSYDKTVEEFVNTCTRFPKRSIVNDSIPRGKGSNILKAISHFPKVDYFVTLDADLVSARGLWLKKFVTPLVNKKAGLVTPVYTRNRYEGNTTNHFSSPIIYACLNEDIVQPIAGDFGFTNELAQDVSKNVAVPSDQMYGIDTLITWTAILKTHKIAQIKLGRKIHKPSFPKIVPMFEQVSLTTFRLINQNRYKIAENLQTKIKKPKRHKIIDDKFVQVPNKDKVNQIERLAILKLDKYKPPAFINAKFYQKSHIFTEEWAEILSRYLCYLLKNRLNIKRLEFLSQSTVGLYLLRVLGYFDEINNATAKETEEILFRQKCLLRKYLTTNFVKNSL